MLSSSVLTSPVVSDFLSIVGFFRAFNSYKVDLVIGAKLLVFLGQLWSIVEEATVFR